MVSPGRPQLYPLFLSDLLGVSDIVHIPRTLLVKPPLSSLYFVPFLLVIRLTILVHNGTFLLSFFFAGPLKLVLKFNRYFEIPANESPNPACVVFKGECNRTMPPPTDTTHTTE